MNFYNPVNPPRRVVFFRMAFFTLAAVFFCQSAPAQNATPRPIARLISNPAAESSRARRASLESRIVESTPVKANETELRAFEQTNKARVENGLPPLTWDDELCRLARAHSEHMALQKFFAHETPEGLRLRDRARANQIHFRLIGENIAYNKGYDDPGGFAVERWMISAGHRANILYAPFQSGAIGSYVAADGSTYLTQVFITR